MNKVLNGIVWYGLPTLFLWLFASVIGSMEKVVHRDYVGGKEVITNNCGKTFPIDYIVWTSMFCEMEND